MGVTQGLGVFLRARICQGEHCGQQGEKGMEQRGKDYKAQKVRRGVRNKILEEREGNMGSRT